MDKIKNIPTAINQADAHMQKQFSSNDTRLWKNTFMKKQIDRRKHQKDESFTIEDHLRAMVYAMISSGSCWERVLGNTNEKTGKIDIVDKNLFDYNVEKLKNCSEKELITSIENCNLEIRFTKVQMPALKENLNKLLDFEERYNSIDNYYYKQFINKDDSLKSLIKALANKGENKMKQLGVALTCEYLRNVGYDLPKPDRHLCRLLGSEYLGLSDKKEADPFDVINIINDLTKESKKSAAEIDYILWSYCASGYGEICTKKRRKCQECKFKQFCTKNNEKN